MSDRVKTVRVRIAVAVTKDGAWNSCGWDKGGSSDMEMLAKEPMDDNCRISWVEADVPLPPEPETIEGRQQIDASLD